jgi:uncharacterized protein
VKFRSPSKGILSLNRMYQDIVDYVSDQPESRYKLIIGTDSHGSFQEKVCFVTAVIIHRVGKGGRYYFCRQSQNYMGSLRQRIYYETYLSLEVASRLTAKMAANGESALNIEIHLDVGTRGDTRDIIKEVVGMVVGSGYEACIKPDSYGASKVADKYTK